MNHRMLKQIIREEVTKALNEETVKAGDKVIVSFPYFNSRLKFAGTVTKVTGNKCSVKYTTFNGGEKIVQTTDVPLSFVEVVK